MPIRFRCPGCEALLSIARRKSGTEIACPKCREALIVPPPVTPASEPESIQTKRRHRVKLPDPEKTELDLSPPSFQPSGGGAAQAVLEPQAHPVPKVHEYAEGDQPPLPKPKPKSPAAPPAPEPPLFEQLDFEKLLDPAPKNAEPKPESGSKPGEPKRPGLSPVDDDGVTVSRGTALTLMLLFALLLGLAFTAGYFVSAG